MLSGRDRSRSRERGTPPLPTTSPQMETAPERIPAEPAMEMDEEMQEEAVDATDVDRSTKKVRLNAPQPSDSQICDIGSEIPRPSYKDKVQSGSKGAADSDPWEAEGEVDYEDGDVTVTVVDGEEIVELSDAFKARLEKPWKFAVVVKLLGRTIGYRALHLRIQSLWKPTGPFKIIDMENNYFVVRFWDQDDFYHALLDGPWTIYGNALSVQPWHHSFRASTNQVSRAVVWIEFPDFPLDRYHTRVLTMLGNRVGSTVKVDINTENPSRAKFAKVAVVVDLMAPLKGTVNLEGETFQVRYEGLPDICGTCGRVGHGWPALAGVSTGNK
ncbi:hypothetical protein Tsubulata_016312 [Turnera subulata]|uniref:DUF4283 domain-containing protein n=1 Tax=Turnera subulata TaxID=218843 RepID=A0A9Q0F956_9ROSI|nr:hypothetical protein Tsubulata_016312 [Turnera subulata]